jgi:hypothetical protein
MKWWEKIIYLNLIEGLLPFKYLGLLAGENSRKLAALEPVLEKLCRKLNSWGDKFVILEGQIMLLNSIPISCFYFWEMLGLV